MTNAPRELLQAMKRAVVLLTLDSCGLPAHLREGISGRRALSSTGRKALRAATELGMVERGADGRTRWSSEYEAVAAKSGDWEQLLAIIRHHVTYLNLVQMESKSKNSGPAARAQVRADPQAYGAYLRGVAESHRERARVFSTLRSLEGVKSLIDLGGGLGAYSTAWMASDPLRTATLVDLPEVIEMVATSLPLPDNQFRLHAADLTQLSFLPKGEVYLLANVLHLFRGWRSVLGSVLSLMPAKATLAILEARSRGASGTFFDLQVHLRSSREGGLIRPERLDQFLRRCGVLALSRKELSAVEDPLDREYWLWLGTKGN